MWVIFKFYNIILKSANVDGGGGGEDSYPQNVDKKTCFFYNPSLCRGTWKGVWLLAYMTGDM